MGKKDCLVEGRGRTPLLRQHEDFAFDWSTASLGHVVLCDKNNNAPDR